MSLKAIVVERVPAGLLPLRSPAALGAAQGAVARQQQLPTKSSTGMVQPSQELGYITRGGYKRQNIQHSSPGGFRKAISSISQLS